MAAEDLMFSEDEMRVDQGLGYPIAYSKLCKDRSFWSYTHGPPFTFTPHSLSHHQVLRLKDLDEMFPIIDSKAKPTTKPSIFASLLWKQLNHLGNAGFDPATFRVDQYGNVLYYHADPASPLAWSIDHWFPCSRGGLTVPSNLKILQWQVCKKKHNNLEFLIPWWDLQVGISINQFLSVFASSNSDFRYRSFSLFFLNGECEELNDSQTVDSHIFPQHFIESKEQVGLAPAAVVLSRRESYDTLVMKSVESNRGSSFNTPLLARKPKAGMLKENENPNMVTNPYQAIVMARNSFKQQEETTKMQGEIQKLDDEVKELTRKNEEEKLTIQDLELVLIKRRRRAEKCRRLAEAQSSYRAMLEKMIRDTMHQSVIYKEQVRLNQAASNALMARLEAQKAICDSSERELHRKFKHRDELEALTRPEWEQARKRSRMSDDSFSPEKHEKAVLYLPGNRPSTPHKKKISASPLRERRSHSVNCLSEITKPETPHKELRVFLEEEQKASEASGLLTNEEDEENQEIEEEKEDLNKAIVALRDGESIDTDLQKLNIEEDGKMHNFKIPGLPESPGEEDEERRKQHGKGNLDKWLQILLDDSKESNDFQKDENNSKTDEIIRKLNLKYPTKEVKTPKLSETINVLKIQKQAESSDQNDDCHHHQAAAGERKGFISTEAKKMQLNTNQQQQTNITRTEADGRRGEGKVEAKNTFMHNPPPYYVASRKSSSDEASFRGKLTTGRDSTSLERKDKRDKGKGLARSESFSKSFRRSPSSPSIILGGMRKGVDCIRKKPSVIGDEDRDDDANNYFLRSSIKSIKKAVKI
ncbi:hypothetical protein DCAR_0729274 [Daucus carota subsp. sativus]|uniref:Uncharacterized protein n=1 Tax=Daucus carota subsp. sativus TaxID=79200 RepID=A0A164U3I5_DAUCS|nr:PREDICTED: uncharacterized protein LOC108193396 [Daucus carota subsp. sativus]WOH09815.1 hypothetical protein DCAR_0729274 [Daucus carota subsp. sativus]